MTVPRATMRLQFHKGFTFDDAAGLVPYFSELGISHVYASPIMTARRGSMHGYDVIDPTHVNPELGGEETLARLVDALRARNMGLIVDAVPNHMAAVTDNPWWMDVLHHGRQSRYAGFFDIDWEPQDAALPGKILLPILGQPYADALAAGEIRLAHDPQCGLQIRYFDHLLPVAAQDVCALETDAYDPSTSDGRERLHLLLERQHYRLAWWRTANDEINWRRFFDINELAALRMEDEDAFEAVHGTLLRLYAEGLVDGVRIDHVDGLSDPGAYCRKLRMRLRELEHVRPRSAPAGTAYLIVEKILSSNEQLSPAWETDGTTGYDFMDRISAVLHDRAGENPLADLWHRVGGSCSFAADETRSRREILERSFSAQLEATVCAFHLAAHESLGTRDWSRAALRRVLREILVHFPVYRIYARVGSCSHADRAFLSQALAGAKVDCLTCDLPLLDGLGEWLVGEAIPPHSSRTAAIALTRFQQLSAPLSAKAVEDTAFYRYGRLLSRNDVGFDPGRFADEPGDFHRTNLERRSRFPFSLLATATHDHKRGEDVRARLAVLSELAHEWEETLERLLALSVPLQQKVGGAPAPSATDLAMLFQTMVAAWPPELVLDDTAALASFAERIAQWQQKALREAKQATEWACPNEAYESAARDFVMRLFAPRSELLEHAPKAREAMLRKRPCSNKKEGDDSKHSHPALAQIAAFARRIAPAGALNALSQTLLKLTAPGVPDCYQGTEYWDFSLVDPDNRRSVDFDFRRATLDHGPPAELAHEWADGRIKQRLIARVLAVRHLAPRLFLEGDYQPIAAEGPLADHVLAFARGLGTMSSITIACRLPACLLDRAGGLCIPASAWKDTRILVPPTLRSAAFSDVLRGGVALCNGHDWRLGEILDPLPIALLVNGG